MFSYIGDKGVLLLFSTLALTFPVLVLYDTHFRIILLGSLKNPIKALVATLLDLWVGFGDMASLPS